MKRSLGKEREKQKKQDENKQTLREEREKQKEERSCIIILC
jgi:hypothetical protein